jgi:precorrin-2 dehydrogenase/sirohydrochlorin ferrochelatase
MEAFPAFVPLEGRTIVLAGSGPPAEAKARLLVGSPATLVRLGSPQAFDITAYQGAAIAFVAGEDAAFREAAAAAARAAHVPVNVVDHPELSDFYSPAIVDRGQVVVAIGTAGASPMLAAMLRTDIEALVPEGTGRVAELLKTYRTQVRQAFPEFHHQRAFLREVLSGPPAVAALVGDMEEAGRLLLEALGQGLKGLGAVRFVAGRGPADLLTIRAARVLAAADVLVSDPQADPQVMALVRRDAERLEPQDAPSEALIKLAQEGHRVVRLIVGAPQAADIKALTAAGVRVDVLLAAPGP